MFALSSAHPGPKYSSLAPGVLVADGIQLNPSVEIALNHRELISGNYIYLENMSSSFRCHIVNQTRNKKISLSKLFKLICPLVIHQWLLVAYQ